MLNKTIFSFCLILFSLSSIRAQVEVYPVSVITQLTPPYSVNLPDYAAPGCEQLKAIIVQRDLTQAPYMLYLKMQIELNGRIIIRSAAEYSPPALILEPGIPTVISGTDLTPFFDPQNMEFAGYSRDAYMRSKVLPEGSYTITFTAYDWTRRDVALSRGGSFFCYLAKSEPPVLNLPFNNTFVPFNSSQYINFQWLSRTSSSPNSAFSTKYLFELFEMRVGGIHPSEIVQTTKPIFATETDRSGLIYSIGYPVLEEGMRYAWRVRAFDTQGKDYIRNNGYSEVFNFIYGGTGKAFNEIENFMAQALSTRKARLTWDATPGYDSYKVFYRKQGNNNKWYESETVLNNAEVNGLTQGVIYECRVQGKSKNTWGSFSRTDTVMLPYPPLIECGSPYQPLVVSNREPLLELMRLEQFDAGGFMVTIIDPYAITTKPGRFTGRGFVQVPLFGHKKIRCEFTDIFINTDYQLVEGRIRMITDNTPGGDNAVWDVDEVFEGGADNGSVVEGTEEVALIIPDVVIAQPESIILDTAHREIIIVNESNDSVRIDISTELQDNSANITVQDSEGSLYSIDTKTGKATSLGKVLPSGSNQQLATLPSIIDARKGTVFFEPVPGETRFAFDKRDAEYARANLFNEEYKTIKTSDGSLYDVPFKLIPVGETDIVMARAEIKSRTVDADSIVFRSGTGTTYKKTKTGRKGQYLLTLPSGRDNDGIEIYATWTDSKGQSYVLGKLIVLSYSVKRPKLTLVPVGENGTAIDPAIVKEELDKIYHPVAVDWQVSMDMSDFRAEGGELDVTGSGLFSQYTDGMMKLNNEFVMHKKESFDPSTIYLFLLQESDDGNTTGDMPRSKQFGYIFTRTAEAGGKEALYRTIAHEIAHGTFSLKHPFDSQYQLQRGSTDNLLDYTAGTELVKHQWDAIHDPGLVIGMFERDEDGVAKIPITKFVDYTDLGIDFTAFTCDIPDNLTFITPAGYPIVLPKKFKFCFSGITTRNELNNSVPLGVLTAFKDNLDVVYVGSFRKENETWKFVGYRKRDVRESELFRYPESEVKQLPSPCRAIIGVEVELDCKINIGLIRFNGNYKTINLSQPQVVSSNFNYSEYQPTFTASYDIETCRLPVKISSLTRATCAELFSSEVWVKYNTYGDGGVLLKYKIEGKDYYVYSNTDQEGKSYYFTFDNEINKWRNYIPPRIEGVINSFGFLFNPKVLAKAAKDGGHQSLDIMGMIPLIGEGFDVLNGVWYLFEGEKGQSVLCFASTLPVVGWVTQGGKWVWKGARRYGKAINTAAGLEFIEIADDAVETITKKVNELNFHSKAIDDLAADLKNNPGLLEKFAENPELLSSWKALATYPDLRRISGNLEVLNKIQGKFTYNNKTGQEALEEIFAGHRSVQKIIDNLKKYEDLLVDMDDIIITGIKSSSEVRILNNYKQIGKFIDGNLHINYSGFGGEIVCDPDKTTTILGKWQDPAGAGTNELLDSKLFKVGENKGGINVLSFNNTGMTEAEQWALNSKWLNDAADRGDIIRVVSDPNNPVNVFKPDGSLSFFGNEIDLLGKLGYKYDPSSLSFIK